MGIVGEKVAELKKYNPKLTRQADFEDFWQTAMEELFPEKKGLKSWKIDVESPDILKEFLVGFELELEDYAYH